MNSLLYYSKHYVFGLATAAFNGGIAAIAAIVGPSVAGAVGVTVPSLSPHQVAATFAGGCALAAFNYFKAHPLPEKLEEIQAAAPNFSI